MRKPKTSRAHPVLGNTRPTSTPATPATSKSDVPYSLNMTPSEVRSINQKRIDELTGKASTVTEPQPGMSLSFNNINIS